MPDLRRTSQRGAPTRPRRRPPHTHRRPGWAPPSLEPCPAAPGRPGAWRRRPWAWPSSAVMAAARLGCATAVDVAQQCMQPAGAHRKDPHEKCPRGTPAFCRATFLPIRRSHTSRASITCAIQGPGTSPVPPKRPTRPVVSAGAAPASAAGPSRIGAISARPEARRDARRPSLLSPAQPTPGSRSRPSTMRVAMPDSSPEPALPQVSARRLKVAAGSRRAADVVAAAARHRPLRDVAAEGIGLSSGSTSHCAHHPTCPPFPTYTQADPQSPQAPPPERSPSFEFSPPAPGAGQQGTPQRPGAAAGPSSPLRASVSPGEARALKAASRRAAAAEWIRAQTGIEVPADTDFVFRQALRDGIALCRLLNSLRPGAVSKVLWGVHTSAAIGVQGAGVSCGAASCHAESCPPSCLPSFPPIPLAGHRSQHRRVQQPHGRRDPHL